VPLDGPKPRASDARSPSLDTPKNDAPKTDPPKPAGLQLPAASDTSPMIPSLDPSKMGADPKLPPLALPGGAPAPPSPAPGPETLIPPQGIPNLKTPDALPPLTLPPDAPAVPDRPARGVEAKSSPLTDPARDLSVRVFPAAGAAAAPGLRKIGFFNHTKHDLALTIEGKTVTLPAMSYLHAQVPPTFTWKCADRPAATETVPADASGLDVLIRE
jgi:hypothetical protein